MKHFLPFLFFPFIALPLLAQVSWLVGSGAYENASKWSTGIVPGSSNETIYPAGTYTITVDTVVTNARMRFENASVNAEIQVGPSGGLVVTNGLVVKNGSVTKPNSVTISSGTITMPNLTQTPLTGVAEGSYGTLVITNATLNAAGLYWYVGRNSNETRNRMMAGPNANVTTPQIVCGDAGTANLNELIVQGQGASWYVNGQTRVGLTGRLNMLVVTNGGIFRTCAIRIGANLGGNSNRVYVADGGYFELYDQTGGDNNFHVGSSGAYNEVLIASNGLINILRSNSDVGIGVNTGSSNNTLTINAGGILTNLATFYVGKNNNAVSNSLVIKGGLFAMPTTNILTIGNSSEGNSVQVLDNGLIDMLGEIRIGASSTGRNNTLLVSDATVNAPSLTIGYSSTDNAAILTHNAQVSLSTTNQISVTLGANVTARSNRLEVTDGAAISGLRNLTIGLNSTGNSLYVGTNGNVTFGNLFVGGQNANCSSNSLEINGGLLTTTRTNDKEYNYIGYNGSYNAASVRNAGVLESPHRIYLGAGGTTHFNTLTISEGGIVRCSDMIIGDNGSSNNVVVVTGPGSCLLSRGVSPLRIGAGTGCTGNMLAVLDGAFVDAGNSSMGVTYANTSTNNTMIVSNATVYCTNNMLYAWNQSTITIQGSNSLVRCKDFKLYAGSSLVFEIPRDGLTAPALDVTGSVTLSADARLYVSAPEWFAKVGGRLPLIHSASTNDMATFTTQSVLAPEGLSLALSADSKTLYLVGPSRAATVLLVR